METVIHNESKVVDTKRRQRFFVGESDSEYESDDEIQHRFSISDSECSDQSSDLIGGPPTTFNFAFEEDSGLGMGSSLENDDEWELRDDTTDPSLNQILPLKNVNIGNTEAAATEHKKKKRNHKACFYDYYELTDDFLGSGAYALVQTAISKLTGLEYAVKLVDRHDPSHTRSRILKEIEIHRICRGNANFVQLIEWFEDADYFYMVFEKMRGGPLLAHIQRQGHFNEQEASMVTKDIATALKFLHSRGCAHRDIKPENILCTDMDRVSPVKVCDFDLASRPRVNPRCNNRELQPENSVADLSSIVGSAEFMAPEILTLYEGESLNYSTRCDMWSLGCLCYILLVGYPPFYGSCSEASCQWNQGKPCDDCQESLFERIQLGEFDFPEEEWSSISDEAKDLISHLLVKDARQRYTAADVLAHPWITQEAPRVPLQTANNLFRNDSARDVTQLNEHFRLVKRFTATRLSDRLEETIPSLGTTPEDFQLSQSTLNSSRGTILSAHWSDNEPSDELAQRPQQMFGHTEIPNCEEYVTPSPMNAITYTIPPNDNPEYLPILPEDIGGATGNEQVDQLTVSEIRDMNRQTKVNAVVPNPLDTPPSPLALANSQAFPSNELLLMSSARPRETQVNV